MTPPDNIQAELSTELLDTQGCQQISSQLNEFENSFFGADFFWQHEWIQRWIDSGCLFSAAVRGAAGTGLKEILAAASIFITSCSSRDELFEGKIADFELNPWFACPQRSPPTFYASSLISFSRAYRLALYGSLLDDLDRYTQQKQLRTRSGFAIASSAAGHRHLEKLGFQLAPGVNYLGKYDCMVVSPATANNDYWKCLLRLGDSDSVQPYETPRAQTGLDAKDSDRGLDLQTDPLERVSRESELDPSRNLSETPLESKRRPSG